MKLWRISATIVLLLGMQPVASALAQTRTRVTGADVAVVKTDFVDPVASGENLTYFIAVSNGGPSAASNVTITDKLPLEVAVTEVTPVNGTAGTCSWDPVSRTASCNVGRLAAGQGGLVAIYTTALVPGTIANTATVKATERDPNGANNTSTETTRITASRAPDIYLPPQPDVKKFIECVVWALNPWNGARSWIFSVIGCRP
ncbi:MAG TPA: DUF11 domain-containing protein [Actinomycetota bacterium]|nr:DUF11 domain-containing protein [Actinomycetota bacterium]